MMNREELTENLVNYITNVLHPYKAIKRANGLIAFRHLYNAEERCYRAINFFFDILDSEGRLTEKDEEEINNHWTYVQSEFKALRGE